MTDSTAGEAIAAVLHSAHDVLLDFDGPVCSVFARVPAAEVAQSMLHELSADGLESPRPAVDDPMVILSLAGAISERVGRRAHQLLAAAELTAIVGAEPTPGSADFLAACAGAGRRVAIVTNNSREAVKAYLVSHSLDKDVATICARDACDMTLMKPHPYLLTLALSALGRLPRDVIMIGDSISDIEAASALGAPSIGYANRPYKIAELSAAGAALVVTSMSSLAAGLQHDYP
jgi:HAD superfamily hydrolase (TIGR01509 family)